MSNSEYTPIDGLWHSTYTYGQDANGQPLTSEHQIDFESKGANFWLGTSRPNDSGSEVSILLNRNPESRNEHEYGAEWEEQTSPTGEYGGQAFSGLLLFVMKENGTVLDGKWLGVNRTGERVNAGEWVLRRVAEETNEPT